MTNSKTNVRFQHEYAGDPNPPQAFLVNAYNSRDMQSEVSVGPEDYLLIRWLSITSEGTAGSSVRVWASNNNGADQQFAWRNLVRAYLNNNSPADWLRYYNPPIHLPKGAELYSIREDGSTASYVISGQGILIRG